MRRRHYRFVWTLARDAALIFGACWGAYRLGSMLGAL